MLNQKFNTSQFGPQKSLLQILTYGDKEPEFDLEKMEIIGVEASGNDIGP